MAKVKKSVRKLVTLPLDTAERVDQFRAKAGLASESDALKTLIEGGLSRYDTREELFIRCQTATASGQSIGEIINTVVADHPLVKRTSVDAISLRIYLRDDPENQSEFRLVFFRKSKRWIEEVRQGHDDWMEIVKEKPRPLARSKAELDDDIPF